MGPGRVVGCLSHTLLRGIFTPSLKPTFLMLPDWDLGVGGTVSKLGVAFNFAFNEVWLRVKASWSENGIGSHRVHLDRELQTPGLRCMK